MSDSVLVRLVPKPVEGESMYLDLATRAGSMFQHFIPDPNRGLAALKLLFQLGVRPWMTPFSALEGRIPRDKVEEIFQARIIEDKDGDPCSEEGLQVPEVLQDLIAFAYVPKPPEFFAASPIAPPTETYHLRLEDMAMMLGASRCHREGWTGKGVSVAVIDTGFAPHPYFEQHGYRISRVGDQPTVDFNGHGTGISANVLAVAPDCHLIGVKDGPSAAGDLERALEQRPRIISCSWGWSIDVMDMLSLTMAQPDRYWELFELELLFKRGIADGTAFIFAGGNGQRIAPACMPWVMAVGGVTVNADASFRASDYASGFQSLLYEERQVPDFCGVVGEADGGGHIMLPVPLGCQLEGENLTTKVPGWGIFSGTSSAAPQVAGLCALLLQLNRDLTQEDLRTILASTCRDVLSGKSHPSTPAEAVEGPDLATGAGFVDAYAACRLAKVYSDVRPKKA